MASDRQRSKQRQQQRREERLARRKDAGGSSAPESAAERAADLEHEHEIEDAADLEVGAPPQDIGSSAHTLRDEPPAPSFDTDDDMLLDESEGGTPGRTAGGSPDAHSTREGGDGHKRGRLAAFLVAVWAELQRVQWPDRKQLTQLTGVVLFFVLIVGAYLGALDAIFSKLIQAIL